MVRLNHWGSCLWGLQPLFRHRILQKLITGSAPRSEAGSEETLGSDPGASGRHVDYDHYFWTERERGEHEALCDQFSWPVERCMVCLCSRCSVAVPQINRFERARYVTIKTRRQLGVNILIVFYLHLLRPLYWLTHFNLWLHLMSILSRTEKAWNCKYITVFC